LRLRSRRAVFAHEYSRVQTCTTFATCYTFICLTRAESGRLCGRKWMRLHSACTARLAANGFRCVLIAFAYWYVLVVYESSTCNIETCVVDPHRWSVIYDFHTPKGRARARARACTRTRTRTHAPCARARTHTHACTAARVWLYSRHDFSPSLSVGGI